MPIAPPYEGPLPKEGVSGLPGTKVQIFLRSNRPLSGGTIDCGAASRRQPVSRNGVHHNAGKPAIRADEADRAGQPGGRRASSRSPATGSSSAA